MKTDFLIIGSGIAGLTFALKTANKFPKCTITIVTKVNESESNTRYAQGGLAVVLDKKRDSFSKHISDTIKAGDGLCDRKTVDLVVKEAPKRVEELIGWGVIFDKQNGVFHFGKEGGHTANRILHHADATGLEIEKKLLAQVNEKSNIKILKHHLAIDLITASTKKTKTNDKNKTCFGAYVFEHKEKRIIKIISRITLLASGGVGQIYSRTTNPPVATGDGIGMAFRAKARIGNMEFIQFHPTALYEPGKSTLFLISEAVRGLGAVLRNSKGGAFMHKYDARGELASRDIVSRAIYKELEASGETCVYLDCRKISKKDFMMHFPGIHAKCLSIGIDVTKKAIPVIPAAHYLCGGIKTDAMGMTSITNLYACGECACTGLHGANRLASNSLLEALVFAHRCYMSASQKIKKITIPLTIPDRIGSTASTRECEPIAEEYINRLRHIMGRYAGIIRTNKGLKIASNQLQDLARKVDALYKKEIFSPGLFELRNMVDVSKLVIKHSLRRKVNRGGFYNANNVSGKSLTTQKIKT